MEVELPVLSHEQGGHPHYPPLVPLLLLVHASSGLDLIESKLVVVLLQQFDQPNPPLTSLARKLAPGAEEMLQPIDAVVVHLVVRFSLDNIIPLLPVLFLLLLDRSQVLTANLKNLGVFLSALLNERLLLQLALLDRLHLHNVLPHLFLLRRVSPLVERFGLFAELKSLYELVLYSLPIMLLLFNSLPPRDETCVRSVQLKSVDRFSQRLASQVRHLRLLLLDASLLLVYLRLKVA